MPALRGNVSVRRFLSPAGIAGKGAARGEIAALGAAQQAGHLALDFRGLGAAPVGVGLRHTFDQRAGVGMRRIGENLRRGAVVGVGFRKD